MERIKMLSTAASAAGSFQSGRTYAVPEDMPAELADDFVAVGAAERADVPNPPTPSEDGPAETATAPPAEKATGRPGRVQRGAGGGA